jgi:hypothetical protein
LTKIISAARGTGKSSYLKEIEDSVVVVVPNEKYKRVHNYEHSITAEKLLEAIDHRGKIKGYSDRFVFAFEEPGLYDLTFYKLLTRIPEEQVKIVIGTPMGKMNLFDWYLRVNVEKVQIWAHAIIPEHIRLHGTEAEKTGKFL